VQTEPGAHWYPPPQHDAGTAQMQSWIEGETTCTAEHSPPSPQAPPHVGYVPAQKIGKQPGWLKSSMPNAKPLPHAGRPQPHDRPPPCDRGRYPGTQP
jgi:hypothetical protein